MLDKIKITKVAVVISLLLTITSCSEQKTTQQYLTEIESSLAAENFSDAIILAKNAIRAAPRDASLRVYLAQAYLEQGNYINAEKEFEKALSLGTDKLLIINDLVSVKSKLERVDEVYQLVEDGADLEDEKFVILLTYAGITALKQGDLEKGQDYLGQAISVSETTAFSQVAKGYLSQSKNNFQRGLQEIEVVIEANNIPEATLLKGHLLFALENYGEAAAIFSQYVKRYPSAIYVKFFEINSLIHAGDIDRADQLVLTLLAMDASSPLAQQYKAQIEFKRGDYKKAKEFADGAARQGDDYLVAKMIAGVSAYHLGDLEQAYANLNPLEKYLSPEDPLKRVIAYIKLKLGYEVDALTSLSELEQLSVNDVDLLLSAGFELLKTGNSSQVQQLLEQSATVEFKTPAQKIKMGLLQLSLGDVDGLAMLQDAVKSDPQSDGAKIALANTYIKLNQLDKAFVLVQAWHEAQPDSTTWLNLSAGILLRQEKTAEAIQDLNKVIALQPENIKALTLLAMQALNDKKIKQAVDILEKILTSEPDNLAALSLLFGAMKVENKTDIAIERIKQSYLRNQQNMKYRLFYAKTLLEVKAYQQVVKLLANLTVDNTTVPATYWVYLGGSYSFLGDNINALVVFEDWINKRPHTMMAWYSKLSIQDKFRDMEGALFTVEKMIKKFPQESKVKAMLPYYQIQNKQFDEAEQSILTLTKEQIASAFVIGLQGQVLLAKKAYQKAYPKLLIQYNEKESPKNAGLVYTSLLKAKKQKQAFKFMAKHLKQHPNDIITKTFYAQLALQLDLKVAQQNYTELLVEFPENLVFLNNLIWTESKLGNVESAMALANRALLIDKDQANVLDSLAMLYYQQGKITKASELLTRARDLAPKNKTIARHYSKVMAHK